MALFPGWNGLLRELRERSPQRYSQTDVGKIVGLSGKAISSYETGKVEPQLDVFSMILELYGIRDLVQLQRELARFNGTPEPELFDSG